MKKITGILFLTLFLSSTAASAAEEHIVAKGDTLFKLSRQYGLGVDQLKTLNHLSSDTLYLGQKLVLSTKPAVGAKAIALPEAKPVLQEAVGVRFSGKRAIVTENVNLRQEGHLESKILTVLKKGTAVDIQETGELWTQVKWGKIEGYIYTPLLGHIPKQEASRSGDLSASRIQQLIAPLVGIPYVTGGATLNGFDCSGFTMYVMDQLGVKLPRVSEEQFALGIQVERENWKAGDLLFFDSYGSGKISHVGIYIGNNKMAHSAVKSVEISDVTWYINNYPFYGAKRVLGE
ncbi:NlpC/P60 family protein [Ammoniphilus sp. 3BR4]|uniref:C40 family peptidase n=1 Tax=Ammoniphilus sp. 3BR4 TaxID=3158265 RepID=UPI003465345E